MNRKMKALALLSGGLDSTLAVKLILNQGIEVETINFVTPFCLCKKGCSGAAQVAKKFHIPLKIVKVGEDYLKMLRNPKYGYGRNMNPCIDCRIFMLKKAKKHAKETGASFIFTGEVLDERPMSQHWKALSIIEKEAGFEGKILRPLSARLLPETEAEKKGWVDRAKLLDIRGRSRKKQIALAKEFGVTDYPCPAGGCLLTYKEYANKLRDLFEHKKRVSLKDIQLLKIGRHFRLGRNKILVGRNEDENKILFHQKFDGDYCFEAQGCGSPISILQGPKTTKAIETAARLTAYYSDQKAGGVLIKFGREGLDKSVMVAIPNKEEVDELRIKRQKI
jgi:tRNA-specific 2-thiouridylase